MDPNDSPNERFTPPQAVVQRVHKNRAKPMLLTLLVILLVVAAGGGAYYWRDKKAKDERTTNQKQISQLQGQVGSLKDDVKTEQDKTKAASAKATTTSGPSQATLDNVKASITSGNTAALTGYMNTRVLVIVAASEGIGSRTAAQATTDVTSYIKAAKVPWDFALSSATLTSYGIGDYAQYFSNGATVGKSADDYVISFVFNNAGKITTVFMTNSAKLL